MDEMNEKSDINYSCKFCLCKVENFDYCLEINRDDINMLSLFFPNLEENFQLSGTKCNFCETKLVDQYDFKTRCLSTEDRISFKYDWDNKKTVEISKLIETNPKNQICRICLKIIDIESNCTAINKSEMASIIKNCLPEINLTLTLDPIICEDCSSKILNCHNFISMISTNCPDILQPFPPKQSTKKPKSNKNIIRSHSRGTNIKCEVKSELDNLELVIQNGGAPTNQKKIRKIRCDKQLKSIITCPLCSYSTTYKKNYHRHSLLHSDFKQFRCEQCDYRGKTKDHLKKHMMVHEESVQLYQCGKCSYNTKRKGDLKKHTLVHEDAQFQCAHCKYETKRWDHLKKHMNAHYKSDFKKSKKKMNIIQ